MKSKKIENLINVNLKVDETLPNSFVIASNLVKDRLFDVKFYWEPNVHALNEAINLIISGAMINDYYSQGYAGMNTKINKIMILSNHGKENSLYKTALLSEKDISLIMSRRSIPQFLAKNHIMKQAMIFGRINRTALNKLFSTTGTHIKKGKIETSDKDNFKNTFLKEAISV